MISRYLDPQGLGFLHARFRKQSWEELRRRVLVVETLP